MAYSMFSLSATGWCAACGNAGAAYLHAAILINGQRVRWACTPCVHAYLKTTMPDALKPHVNPRQLLTACTFCNLHLVTEQERHESICAGCHATVNLPPCPKCNRPLVHEWERTRGTCNSCYDRGDVDPEDERAADNPLGQCDECSSGLLEVDAASGETILICPTCDPLCPECHEPLVQVDGELVCPECADLRDPATTPLFVAEHSIDTPKETP
jgi:hypothetical protein